MNLTSLARTEFQTFPHSLSRHVASRSRSRSRARARERLRGRCADENRQKKAGEEVAYTTKQVLPQEELDPEEPGLAPG